MTGQKTKVGNIAVAEIGKLLDKQTETILAAVDDKLSKSAAAIDNRFSKIERQIEALDLKFSQKFDRIITLLDKVSKRLTDSEQEFELMKRDLKRVKAVIKEKLGIEV